MAEDIQDIERSWAARNRRTISDPFGRTRRLVDWCVLTALLAVVWVATWCGWSHDLGAGMQRSYGVTAADASWWLRADSHLHAVIGALVTVWAAWGGWLFTRAGSWPGPPVAALVVIIDEVLQIGRPGRSFEWRDPLAGGVGILIATVVIVALAVRESRSHNGSQP